jgi:2,3,4,5-tetrahydropyridine-2-carboxylate N-succinyltransferase
LTLAEDIRMALTETMTAADLERTINNAWDQRDTVTPRTEGPFRTAVLEAMKMLDTGKLRVAEPAPDGWKVNEWVKKAILLYFRLQRMDEVQGGPGKTIWWDKVPIKFEKWHGAKFHEQGFRAVPGAIVRYSAYIAKNVVLMPSFVNVGAYVGDNTMIDTWATVGSCAQIGKNCHISGGAGIGGVLEPVQAAPVIIEDDVFVGARSEVAEGVRVGRGSVLSMGVFLGASTKIVHRETGQIFQGFVPPYSVVVPGTLPGRPLPDGTPGPSLYCAVIVKTVDEQTRKKTALNDLLRT